MDLKQEQKKLKAEIEALKEQKAALVQQKIDLAKEINKPIYEAKEKADAMIAEAEKKVQTIKDQATKELNDAAVTRHDANELMHIAKSTAEEIKQKQIILEHDRINFDAERYAIETNVKKAQMEADGLFSKANNLQKNLNDLKIQFDAREGALNKREQEWQERVNILARTQEETKQKLVDLSCKQEELDKVKIEIEKVAQSTRENLEKNKGVLKELNDNTYALQDLQGEVRNAQAELGKQKADLNAQFDLLEKNKADIAERETSVHEKERLLEKKSREVDGKIRTLNQLRSQ